MADQIGWLNKIVKDRSQIVQNRIDRLKNNLNETVDINMRYDKGKMVVV